MNKKYNGKSNASLMRDYDILTSMWFRDHDRKAWDEMTEIKVELADRDLELDLLKQLPPLQIHDSADKRYISVTPEYVSDLTEDRMREIKALLEAIFAVGRV